VGDFSTQPRQEHRGLEIHPLELGHHVAVKNSF
jgi:hypothetical protein